MKFSKPLVFLTLLVAIVLLYWGLDKVYFQQDEWSGFGKAIYSQLHGFTTLIQFSGFHFTPLTSLNVGLFYWLFELNPLGYAIFGLFMHLLNSFLVYIWALLSSKSKKTSLIAAVVFLTAYTPSQAVTWYAAAISFLPSAFFALCSLILFEYFLLNRKKTLMIISIILIIVASLYRENAIFLIGYFGLRLIFSGSRNLKLMLAVILIPLVYLILRLGPVLSSLGVNFESAKAQYLEFLVFYLPKLIVPEPVLRFMSNSIPGSPLQYLMWEKWTRLFYAGVSVIAVLVLIPNLKNKLVVNLYLFLLLSILPFSLLPIGLILESRHLYLSAVAYSALVGHFCASRKIGLVIAVVIVAINAYFIRDKLNKLIPVGMVRQAIVQEFRQNYSKLPEKSIFISRGDALPFQSGVGQMMMVVLNDSNDYSNHLEKRLLWDTKDQGYIEINGIGFGYFYDQDLAFKEFCKQELKKESLFSFNWDAKISKLTDQTELIRTQVSCPITN